MKRVFYLTLVNSKLLVTVDKNIHFLCKSFTWRLSNSGYAHGRVGSNMVWLHRFVMGCNLFDNKQIDHIDRNRLNNCKINLRLCNQTQNNANSKLHKTNTSGYKGVYFDKRRKNWYSNISIKNKTMRIGTFKSKVEAALAYNKKAKELYEKFATLNIV